MTQDETLLVIVDRFIDEPEFRSAVTADPASALAEYKLAADELATITDFYAQLGNPTEAQLVDSLTTMRRQGAA